MPTYLTESQSQKTAQRYLKQIQMASHPNYDDFYTDDNSDIKKQKKLRSHVEGTMDWIFFLLISFAILKDIYDIVSAGLLSENSMGSGSLISEIFKELVIQVGVSVATAVIAYLTAGLALPAWLTAAAPALARVGRLFHLLKQAAGAIKAGIDLAAVTIAPFMFNLMFQWFAFVALLLASGQGILKKIVIRWKLIIVLTILEFITESFLGLNWFPWATFYALLLYYIVLQERRKSALQELPLAQNET